MFMIRRPAPTAIDLFLSSQQDVGFSYSEVGSTRSGAPAGYIVDHNRVRLGRGIDVFLHAVEALQCRRMFDLGWVELFRQGTPIERNATVAVLVHHFGFWSLNACRIVYVFKEERSYGFGYGTLQDHAEQGEERFSVAWSADDDSVWYDILAFSRPRQWQAKLARPVTRMLQKKFARGSKAAMTLAVLDRAAQQAAGADR
jgi:uncharacterized protein (UPF0548 family)